MVFLKDYRDPTVSRSVITGDGAATFASNANVIHIEFKDESGAAIAVRASDVVFELHDPSRGLPPASLLSLGVVVVQDDGAVHIDFEVEDVSPLMLIWTLALKGVVVIKRQLRNRVRMFYHSAIMKRYYLSFSCSGRFNCRYSERRRSETCVYGGVYLVSCPTAGRVRVVGHEQ